MDPALTRRMEQVDFDEGTVLVEQGESQPWLWFIVDGRVRATLMSEGGPVTVGQVSAPVWLGEIGFIDGGPATATLTCAGPVRLLRLHRDALPTLLVDAPDAASRILRRVNGALAGRLTEAAGGELDAAKDGSLTIRPADRPSRVRRVLGRLWGVR